MPGKAHECDLLEAPLKKWSRANGSNDVTQLREGVARASVDTETVLILALRIVEMISNSRGGYRTDTV